MESMVQLYTPKEISELFKLNYRKVLDLIALGELKAYKIGKVLRIPENEIHRFLSSVELKPFWKKKR